MKTVRILSGAYGLRANGRTNLVLKGNTCCVEDDEAKRLVDLGAAVVVGEAAPKPTEKPAAIEADEPAETEEDDADVEDDEEIELETMTNAQLIAMCKEMGINTKTLTNKTKLINAIKAKQDEMPDLGAEDFE